MINFDDFLERGFEAAKPSELDDLASELRDRCYSTGDVRFCIASECLEIIASCWGDDGAVRTALAEDLKSFARGEFAAAFSEPDIEASRSLLLGARGTLLSVISAAGDFIYG